MNENAVFFSGAGKKKKNSFEIEWMNGQRTFPQAKKNRKFAGNFLEKTKIYLFFFSAFSGKKKTRFLNLNEWMANVHARGKKKYGTFGRAEINSLLNFFLKIWWAAQLYLGMLSRFSTDTTLREWLAEQYLSPHQISLWN